MPRIPVYKPVCWGHTYTHLMAAGGTPFETPKPIRWEPLQWLGGNQPDQTPARHTKSALNTPLTTPFETPECVTHPPPKPNQALIGETLTRTWGDTP